MCGEATGLPINSAMTRSSPDLISAHGPLRLLLQVHPCVQGGLDTYSNKDASHMAERECSRVPGRVHQHVCHDGEWAGGVQGEQTLRKGSQETGASERWGSVRATHDLLPTSGPWIALSLPQPLREKHRKTRICLSHQVFLGEKGLTICGAK